MTRRFLHGSLYLLCFLSATLFSCKKNPDKEATNPGSPYSIPAASPVNGSLTGRIIDENSNPVAAALVECAGLSASTNAEGFFKIDNATLDKYITTVTVSKSGYFKGYRSFSATASSNFVNIKLTPKSLAGTISSTTGGSVSLSNSSVINFQANSMVIKSSGAVYNGTVNIYAAYIDPTADDIAMTVPGSFMGRDANNLYVLASTGMLALEMESGAGEPLQLASNMPATVKLKIPSSLTANAPHTIDTWSLNDAGVWSKEGTAVKTGDFYEFQASHFSFWNTDQPTNAVHISLHITDQSGNNLTNTQVSLSFIGMVGVPGTTYGITDGNGDVAGMVPAGFVLTLKVYPSYYNCGVSNAVYTQDIGPYNVNTPVTITVPNASIAASTVTISGTANDCTGAPLVNGTAYVYSPGAYAQLPVVNGIYSGSYLTCDVNAPVAIVIHDNNSVNSSSNAVIGTAVANNLVMPLITLPCGIALNIYDGIYQSTGTFTDVVNSSFTINYPKQIYLITTGINSVIVGESINGAIEPGCLFLNAGAGTYYGNFGLQMSFDGSTNLINDLHNYYGDPANPLTGVGDPALGTGFPLYQAAGPALRSARLDATGFNDYNPTTKVIRVKYHMYQANVSVTPNPRCYFDETWTYIGPR